MNVQGALPVYRRTRGAASCRLGASVAEIGVNGAVCHIGASNLIPVLLPRSWGSGSYEVGKMSVGSTDVMTAGLEARNPGWSAPQSLTSSSAGGLGEAPDLDA